jgi:hypothetical protein
MGCSSARRRQGSPAAHDVRLLRQRLSLPSCAGARDPPRDTAKDHLKAQGPSTALDPTRRSSPPTLSANTRYVLATCIPHMHALFSFQVNSSRLPYLDLGPMILLLPGMPAFSQICTLHCVYTILDAFRNTLPAAMLVMVHATMRNQVEVSA